MLRDTYNSILRRDDVEVSTWFLRCAWNEQPWPDTSVVDDLRTWWPASILEAVGLATVAGRLRGARLRWWLRRSDPDLVILDDGLGGRLLEHLGDRTLHVVRRNAQLPSDFVLESPYHGRPDGLMIPPGSEPDPGYTGPVLVEYETRDDWAEARQIGLPESRSAQRERLGLPSDAPLVTGWGDSGWIDGPDVFIRCLWALDQRLDVRAHGVWFGSDADPHERERLRAEAERCGVDDRFHHLPLEGIESWLCGDVVMLPYRDVADDEQILTAICSGAAVVCFPVTRLQDPAVRIVDHLDVETAAAQLAEALAENRDSRWQDTLRRLDLKSLIDELVGLTGGTVGRA